MKPVYQRYPDADVLRLSFNPKFPWFWDLTNHMRRCLYPSKFCFLWLQNNLCSHFHGIRSVLHAHPLLCSSIGFLFTGLIQLNHLQRDLLMEGLKAHSFMLCLSCVCGQIELIACEKWFINKPTYASQPQNLSLLIDMQFSQ